MLLYGHKRVQAAADLVVNQEVDADAYKSAGEKLVLPKDLKLEPDQTLE